MTMKFGTSVTGIPKEGNRRVRKCQKSEQPARERKSRCGTSKQARYLVMLEGTEITTSVMDMRGAKALRFSNTKQSNMWYIT